MFSEFIWNICGYLRLEKPTWKEWLLDRCPAQIKYLTSLPHPNIIWHCALVGASVVASQEGNLRPGLSGDSDAWLRAELPSVAVSRPGDDSGTLGSVFSGPKQRKPRGLKSRDRRIFWKVGFVNVLYRLWPVDGPTSSDKFPVEPSGSVLPLTHLLSLLFSHYFPGDDPALMPNNWEFIWGILSSRLRQTITRCDGKENMMKPWVVSLPPLFFCRVN